MFELPAPVRSFIPCSAALLLLGTVFLSGAHAQTTHGPRLQTPAASPQASPAAAQHWVSTWASPPSTETNNTGIGVAQFVNQTARLIVHTSIPGNSVQIKISNVFGTAALNVGAARIAVRSSDANTVPGTDRVLTFSGSASTSISPGALVVSDPVSLAVPQLGDLAVSLYFPDLVTPLSTVQPIAHQTSYLSANASGDQTAMAIFPVGAGIGYCPFLTDVEVLTPASSPTIVAIGDSITEGYNSTQDANHRWPDYLKGRVFGASTPRPAGIVDQGISGNRLLVDMTGPSMLSRFDRDVFALPGLTHVILLIGINDIHNSGTDAPSLIAGYRQLIARAHDRGIKIIGGTMTPSNEAAGSGAELARSGANAFIRNSAEFDGVVDFDAATRDPANPLAFLPAYDSGDHLHPNDAGYQAMANAVDLSLFNGFVTLNSVVSRKTHGAGAGVYDLPLPQGLCTRPGIESRGGGASGGDYSLVFSFAAPITSVLGAAVAEGVGSVASLRVNPDDPSQALVTLTGVSSGQYVTVGLTNVTDALGNTSSVRAVMGVLVGDAGGDGSVNAADIAQTRSLSGQGVTAANFRADLNLDGVINAADIAFVKSRSGTALPSPAPASANLNP